jgi:type IV secretory pathway VirB3-like protein
MMTAMTMMMMMMMMITIIINRSNLYLFIYVLTQQSIIKLQSQYEYRENKIENTRAQKNINEF